MSAREYPGPLFVAPKGLKVEQFSFKPSAFAPVELHPEEQARDLALASVAENNAAWMAKGLSLLGRMRGCFAQASGEQVRMWLLSQGLGQPTTSHAWGSLINHAVRRGVLVDSGKTVKMQQPGSHSRRTPLWLLA